MALINIETAWLDKFKAAHNAERDLSELTPAHINISAVAVADVGGTPKFKGNVVSVNGSPIKFSAVDQTWNPATLTALLMDTVQVETDAAVFTSNVAKDAFTSANFLCLRLETMTGDGAADLTLIKEHLGVLTNYDFSAAGAIVTAEGVTGLNSVVATDGTAELDGSDLKSENFTYVYKLNLSDKLFNNELVFIVGGNGITELQAKDLGDIVSKQSGE